MENKNYTTKINWIISCTIMIFILLSGCKKEPVLEPENINKTSEAEQPVLVADPAVQGLTSCGADCEKTVDLKAGQYTKVGTVQYLVNNDGTVDVIYTVTSPWKLLSTSLYVGDCNQIPRNSSGNTMPGQYPYKQTFSSTGESYASVSITRQTIPVCGCIAAHAQVKNMSTGATETAWGQGTRFTNTSWAMYYQYCFTECPGTGDQGCAKIPGYWFKDANTAAWPNSMTIGNYSYAPSEIFAIWTSGDMHNTPTSKYCFIQVFAIKRSASTVSQRSSIWTDVEICENYLKSFGQKIRPDYLPNNSQTARNAAARIETWIAAHQCP